MRSVPGTADTENPLLAAALAFAEQGNPVLPLYTTRDGVCTCYRARVCPMPGKHPQLRHGLLDAFTDPRQIRTWWGERGIDVDANLGVRTDYLAIADVDGDEALRALDQMAATDGGGDTSWLETRAARTGRVGGLHLWYLPTGVSERYARSGAGRLGPNLDVKAGASSYIIVPPSLHASGRRYVWVNTAEPRLWPAWLREPQRRPKARRDPGRGAVGVVRARSSYVRAAVRAELERVIGAPEGTRNDTLNASAYALLRFGSLDPDLLEDALVRAADMSGLGWDEAVATVRSARRARRR